MGAEYSSFADGVLDGFSSYIAAIVRDMGAELCCRVCRARTYIAVGKSRLGAKFYACASCSTVFMAPEKFSKPQHEQLTPTLGHLFLEKHSDQA